MLAPLFCVRNPGTGININIAGMIVLEGIR